MKKKKKETHGIKRKRTGLRENKENQESEGKKGKVI